MMATSYVSGAKYLNEKSVKKPSYYNFTSHAKHHGMTSVVAPVRTMKECHNERFPFTHCT